MHTERQSRWLRWPSGGSRMAYGADYNPEQWPREVWEEDFHAMRIAGVNIVSLAIFSWARLQPGPDDWDFGWLDEVMDGLHRNGIAVDLATATASPPPWLTALHPEILPVTERGETIWPGARQHWRPTSPVFREHALRLVRTMAERYAAHPALAAWHVSNELGCHNVYDYSDDAARAFRVWLRGRYGTLDRLNDAWATSFWSQHYTAWDQVLPPRLTASHSNPTQQLDFKRFSSDALKDHLRAERDVLREITPEIPVTTNFMVFEEIKGMNYADWAAEVDFVSNDHYVLPGDQERDELSFSANLTGNLHGGAPWFLMEHSTSAVNWQPVNRAKRAGEMHRDSLTHVAHGADAVCFFQWRQSSGGTERYHSAMVPHAGTDSTVFRAVTDLGATLAKLSPVVGARRKPARAAILFDWESWWTSELDSGPSSRLRYRQEALDWYTALLDAGVRADVVPVAGNWDGYDLVVAPVLHMVPGELAERLAAFVAAGGTLVTTYFSGIVDADNRVWLGGYPGGLRELLGIRIEEFSPLLDGESAGLDNGASGTLWTDGIDVTGDEVRVLASYKSGEQADRPAVTVRRTGAGWAAYVSTRLGPEGIATILDELLPLAGVERELPLDLCGPVELTIRTDGTDEFWFLINRSEVRLTLPDLPGEVLLGAADGTLDPRGVRILRQPVH